MTALPAAALAAVAGFAFGPVTLRLALATRTTTRPSSPTETTAVTALVGLLVAACGRPTLAPLIVLGIAAAVIDLDERRLPDALTATFAIGTALTALDAGAPAAGSALAAAACVLAGALLVKTVNSDVLGWGDIKLLPSLAAMLAVHDPSLALVGLVCATALLCVTVVLIMAAGGRASEAVPYGPGLVVGAFTAPLVA